jgi:RNA-directed DNA polymerase
MAYRPGPVRHVLSPKEDKPDAVRPLGISNFEDKLVQKMIHKVLESIYEPLFLDYSYGFRPGRGCHEAIRALLEQLFRYEVQTLSDVEVANFFGTLDPPRLLKLLSAKSSDLRFLRSLARMFKSGVRAKGDVRVSDEGGPQGSKCRPILANLLAHYGIDRWCEETVKPRLGGSGGALSLL